MSAPISTKLIAEALGVSLQNSPQSLNGVCTDSRQITPGCLFVPIHGDNFDGHGFILDAVQKGAQAFLYSPEKFKFQRKDFPPEILAISVSDPLSAFRKIAKKWRQQFHIPIIAVAGSVGKTTTKELLASILKGHFQKVLKTEKSQNGFLGVALTLVRLNSDYDCAVIEIGIDEKGAMDQHLKIVCPTYSIITALGPEHLEKLGDLKTAIQEETQIFVYSEKNQIPGIINLDEPELLRFVTENPKGNWVGFTLKKDSDMTLSFPSVKGEIIDSNQLQIHWKNQTSRLKLPLPGEHNARNLLGAVTIALQLGVSFDEIQKGLEKFEGEKGRSEVQEILIGSKKHSFLCDYYNSNPTSVLASLKVLSQMKNPSGETWACLGDMLELGKKEEEFHRKLSTDLISHSVDHILLYGPRMKWLYDELKKNSFQGNVIYFEQQEKIAEYLKKNLGPLDTVLIKGSRGMTMERILEKLS